MDPGGPQPKLPLGNSQRWGRLSCFPRSLTCANGLEVLFLYQVIYIESFEWQFFLGDDPSYILDFHPGVHIYYSLCERVSSAVAFFKRRLVTLVSLWYNPERS